MKTRIIIFALAILFGRNVSAQTAEPADKILSKAYSQAAAEKKNVLVIFHASWCKYCKLLEASINDPLCKDIFYKNYVIAELTINESADKKNLENPGAIDLFNANGGKGQGIPYFLFFDSKGKLIADSKMQYPDAKAGSAPSNIGCPMSEPEISAFSDKLKLSSNIKSTELEIIKERFRKNSK